MVTMKTGFPPKNSLKNKAGSGSDLSLHSTVTALIETVLQPVILHGLEDLTSFPHFSQT